jgi:hypothetical protein
MKEIQLKELQRAINYMTAIGCTFKVITPDGQEFGTLEVVVNKPRSRKPLRYEFGAIAGWYRPQIDLEAPIGSVQTLTCGEFSPEDIRSGVCSLLTKHWGKDSYTTNINVDLIEVLRVS